MVSYQGNIIRPVLESALAVPIRTAKTGAIKGNYRNPLGEGLTVSHRRLNPRGWEPMAVKDHPLVVSRPKNGALHPSPIRVAKQQFVLTMVGLASAPYFSLISCHYPCISTRQLPRNR
jgi:hypothetical protein